MVFVFGHSLRLNAELFVEKKYYKSHSNFFTWQWLTKYIFSSIYKHPQAQFFFGVLSCIFLTVLPFQTYSPAILKKNHHLAKSVSNFFSDFFLKLTIFRDG